MTRTWWSLAVGAGFLLPVVSHAPSVAALHAPHPSRTAGPGWSIRIYPKNPAYVEVTVDLRPLSARRCLRGSYCVAAFYRRGSPHPAERQFHLRGDDMDELPGGKAYRMWFPHRVRSAQRV